MTWFQSKPETIQREEGPYRTIAVVPPQPKIETPQERETRLLMQNKNKAVLSVMILSVVPSGALLAIGAEWSSMSTALAVMSLIATALMTIGGITAASIKFE
jgi:hypothetical protein